jgi:hypothetical protein
LNLDAGKLPYDAVVSAALGIVPLLSDAFCVGLAATTVAGLTIRTAVTTIAAALSVEYGRADPLNHARAPRALDCKYQGCSATASGFNARDPVPRRSGEAPH